MRPNDKILLKIIGCDWNRFDAFNLRSIANRLEMIDKNDVHSSTLGREHAVKIIRNLADILEKEYKKRDPRQR